ncbi:hypothetical protein SITYG_14790 [Streptococcus intermedius]|uniref:Uncharacterized protein n=1 Tax=Streptococcus intermedius TaxID=1338 RepID=A0AAD1FJR7_STRIT|nr:hypothetical protein SITYG_14790 [Streptococcus intermedius]
MPFVFSHPDCTVGCGITPHQLMLADLKQFIQLTKLLFLEYVTLQSYIKKL